MAKKDKKIIDPSTQNKKGVGNILIISLIVLLVASVGFTSYLIFFKNDSSPKKEHFLHNNIYYSLGEFKLNLSDEEPSYIQMTLQVSYKDNKKLTEELALKKDGPLRNAVIMTTAAKESSDIKSKEGQEQLKNEILSAINPLLEHGEIDRVDFTEFKRS